MSLKVLEGTHVIAALQFISQNEGCTKTELYQAVSRNSNMPKKLNELESAGLIEQTSESSSMSVRLYLTDIGRKVSRKLSEIEDMLIRQ